MYSIAIYHVAYVYAFLWAYDNASQLAGLPMVGIILNLNSICVIWEQNQYPFMLKRLEVGLSSQKSMTISMLNIQISSITQALEVEFRL